MYAAFILANSRTVTASTAESAVEARLPDTAFAARLTLTITSASGSLTTILQRGRPVIQAGDTTYATGSPTWEDYLSFTTTTTAGTEQKYITLGTTTSYASVIIPTSGTMAGGQWVGPPLGSGPFRLYYLITGASPSFTLSSTAEFEW